MEEKEGILRESKKFLLRKVRVRRWKRDRTWDIKRREDSISLGGWAFERFRAKQKTKEEEIRNIGEGLQLVGTQATLLEGNCSGMTILHFGFTIFFFTLSYYASYWYLDFVLMLECVKSVSHSFIWSLFHLCVLHDSHAILHVLRSLKPFHLLLALYQSMKQR